TCGRSPRRTSTSIRTSFPPTCCTSARTSATSGTSRRIADMAQRRRRPAPNRPTDEREQWYRDAVIYEAHIKAFADSDDDGIGDLRGLTGKLDYLQDLGVTALWLLPFYPSPLKDDGYDIASYREIHP